MERRPQAFVSKRRDREGRGVVASGSFRAVCRSVILHDYSMEASALGMRRDLEK